MTDDARAADPARHQARIQEFLKLLPLTAELAGLPRAEAGRLFSEGQMENRVTALRNAYKLARQLVIEISKD